MEKADIIAGIVKQTNITKAKAKEVFEAVIETIQKALIKGEAITLKNFGKLCVTTSKERMGRNLQTGESILIPMHKRVKFKASKRLKSTLN